MLNEYVQRRFVDPNSPAAHLLVVPASELLLRRESRRGSSTSRFAFLGLACQSTVHAGSDTKKVVADPQGWRRFMRVVHTCLPKEDARCCCVSIFDAGSIYGDLRGFHRYNFHPSNIFLTCTPPPPRRELPASLADAPLASSFRRSFSSSG